MDESWRVHVACLDDRFAGIKLRALNVYSQFGEDGLIEAVFERIGIRNRWCFEVGAADGDYLSNTKVLRKNDWYCLLVESNESHFKRLSLLRSESVFCVHEHVDGSSLDRLLADCGAPTNMDFGCVDIDGQDYWVWDGMRRCEPRVMLVEFSNRKIQDDMRYIPPLGNQTSKQASFRSIRDLGESKGYIAVAKTYVNVLFVKESDLA